MTRLFTFILATASLLSVSCAHVKKSDCCDATAKPAGACCSKEKSAACCDKGHKH